MVVVIAEKEELELVKQLGYSHCPTLVTGPGGLNMLRALRNLPRDTEILNIGYCGSNNIDVGSTVRVTKVGTNYELAKFGEEMRECVLIDYKSDYDAPCYSSTDFVTHTDKEETCIFDMELAFLRAIFDNISAIKVVSDNLSIKEYRDNLKVKTSE